MTAVVEPGILRRASTVRAYEDAVRAVVVQIRRAPEAPLDLAAMAAIAGMSRYHFDRVFRAVTAVSPRQFQTAVRMQCAVRLLLTTDRSVTDVCFDAGYESLGSFVTKFTQTFRLPPQKMRELAGRLDRPWSEWLRHAPAPVKPPLVRGAIEVPPPFEGAIFIGLFPQRMPTEEPLACAITAGAGAFTIGGVPRGEHHLLAVALPWSQCPLDFLLSDETLVGAGGVVRAGTRDVRVLMRTALPTDAPVNLALPFLLMRRTAA